MHVLPHVGSWYSTADHDLYLVYTTPFYIFKVNLLATVIV